jgi:hypothetical protein
LPRVPHGDDLLRINDRLAIGLGALCLDRSLCCGSLAFLCSAIWAHRKIVEHFGAGTNFLCDPFE